MTNNNTTEKEQGITSDDKRRSRKKPFQFPLSATSKPIKKGAVSSCTYFQHRQKKLTAQAPQPKTKLFQGLNIYFTGVRSHSQRKLETLIWLNGGTCYKHCPRKIITHIIADNLCSSKINRELNVSKNKQSIVIVNAQWILQSIGEQKLLPTWNFQVVKAAPNIKTLEQFFKPKTK